MIVLLDLQLVTNLWPMGGDDLYSSLFILKIRGFHLKLLPDSQNGIPGKITNST